MHQAGQILESLDHRLSRQGLALEGKGIHGKFRQGIVRPSIPLSLQNQVVKEDGVGLGEWELGGRQQPSQEWHVELRGHGRGRLEPTSETQLEAGMRRTRFLSQPSHRLVV